MDPSPFLRLRDWMNSSSGIAHAGFALGATFFLLLRFNLFTWKFSLPDADSSFWQAPMAHADWVQRVLTPLRLLGVTTELLVWPPKLSPIWCVSSLPLASHLSPNVVAGLVVLTILLAGGVVLWRLGSIAGPLLLGTVVLLALPLQCFPVINWYFAERWLYLPTVLPLVAIAVAVARLRAAGVMAAMALAALLLPASWSYSAAFHDNYHFFRYVVDHQPDNIHGLRGLGSLITAQGDYASAIQLANDTIARFGDEPDPYAWLARSYFHLGDLDRAQWAIGQFDRAVKRRIRFDLDDLRVQVQRALADRRRKSTSTSTSPTTARDSQ